MLASHVFVRSFSAIRRFALLPSSSILKGSSLSCRTKATAAAIMTPDVVEDKYPSRGNVTKCELLPRHDPVIWGDVDELSQKGPLNKAELLQFQDQGFLIIPDVFSEEEILNTRKDIMDTMAEKERVQQEQTKDECVVDNEGNNTIVSEEGTGKVRSMFALHRTLDSVDRLVRDHRIINRVKQIANDDVYIHQCRFNTHAAFHAPGFAFHTDFEYWHSEDGIPAPRVVFAMVFFSEHIPQNGALMMLPGSHKKFLSVPGATPKEAWKIHQQDPNLNVGKPPDNVIGDLMNKHGIVYCTGKPGTLVLFDSMTVHGSSKNPTPWNRLSYFIGYNSVINKAINPFEAPMVRPDAIATRDPEWMKPIVPV